MTTLTEFLLARLAEDEAVARVAIRMSNRNGGMGRNLDRAKAEERQENVSDVLREALERYVKSKP